MGKLNGINWGRYKAILHKASEQLNKKPITWLKHKELITLRNEDFNHVNQEQDVAENYDKITLACLCNYNYMRTWPINRETISGELDVQTVQIYLNKRYLQENGYLDHNGLFIYQVDNDRFELDGILYKSTGDTSVSQADSEDIHFTMVLQREEKDNI